MAYFKITYGCGCGEEEEYIEARDFDEAYKTAYNAAVENYESYAGYHGILSEADIADEEFGVDLEDADDTQRLDINTRYCEEIENTISYGAEEISEKEWREYWED